MQITFDVRALNQFDLRVAWQRWFEAFCVCKRWSRAA
jgi:hypothetical protein